MDKISVIVPIYNVSKYIERCLESILNQTYKNLQVILIDDGSNDNSGEICDIYAQKYECITSVHKKNSGLGFARNSGLEIATGKFVTFIDGDDYIENNHLEIMYTSLLNNNADTCLSGYTRVYDKRKIVHHHVCLGNTYDSNTIKEEILPRMCGKKNDRTDNIEMSVCMVLFSNDIIQKNSLQFHSERELISEDLIFDFDYYPLAKKVCVCNSVGYCYCDNDGSLTTNYRENRFEMQKKMAQEMIYRSKQLGIFDLCEQRIINTFVSIVRYCIKLEEKFSCDNGKKKALNKIRTICADDVVKDYFSHYDNSIVPFMSRMVNLLIKSQCTYLLWLTMKLKNTFKI